ncbi:MAG: BON domain-containing protein [Burkholderiales bacterium]
MNMKIRNLLLVSLAVPFLQSCAPLLIGAGVGATAMFAEDRRSSGIVLEDQTIESKAKNRIDEKYGSQAYYNVTSFNRHVLLTGQAPTEEIREDLAVLVLEVPNVRNVQNEMVIAGNTSFSSHTSDTFITGRVKGNIAQNKEIEANHVKVVTENGTVFLMGIVTRAEGDAAAQAASTSSGVQRVVKVFEYLD